VAHLVSTRCLMITATCRLSAGVPTHCKCVLTNSAHLNFFGQQCALWPIQTKINSYDHWAIGDRYHDAWSL